MTACSSLLAFGGMPFNLWAYGRYWQQVDDSVVIPYTNILISLAILTAPAIAGMAVRHFHQRAAAIITKVSPHTAGTRLGNLQGTIQLNESK